MSVLQDYLTGGHGVASTERMLSGLSLDNATRRLPGLPYTVYGLLWHIELCQAILLRQLRGEPVSWPPSADQWPHDLPDQADFEALLARLRVGLAEAATRASDPPSLLERERELLEDLCAHNAYHWGQVVTLRRLLGDWEEPG